MAIHKRVVKAGAVQEIECYNIAPNQNRKKAEPKPEKARTPEQQEIINTKQSLKRFIRLINATFGPWAWYVTLTFDEANLPATFAEARKILDNYVRRLQYVHPDLQLVAVLGRGKNTDRIHVHLIVAGAYKKTIKSKWTHGKIKKAVRLRAHNFYEGIDCGRDYTGLATYLFEHWTPEQGGKRWKQTKNLNQPKKYTPTPSFIEYSIEKPPPAPKGYRLIRCYDCNNVKDSKPTNSEAYIKGTYKCFTYVLEDDTPEETPYQTDSA